MPNEYDPVSEDEYVYRRILNEWYDDTSPLIDARVDRQAFRPTSNDTNGLSVYRALFVEPEQLDRDREGNPGRYYVARLAVRSILELGLSVSANPMEGLPGHTLIAEIRHGLKGQEKHKSKDMQFELARLASKDIVYTPPA